MKMRQIWAGAAMALLALGGAAFSETASTRSKLPEPTVVSATSAVSGTRKDTAASTPLRQFASLAAGTNVILRRGGKAEPVLLRYDAAWLASQPAPNGDEEWQCLTKALYFEARGESLKGQFAVAEVILNRADSPRFPSTVCAVVNQGGSKGCQFSYVCDGRKDVMHERSAVDRAGRIARVMLDGAPRALTQGATYFHSKGARPGWAHRFPRTAAIGAHMFYRQP